MGYSIYSLGKGEVCSSLKVKVYGTKFNVIEIGIFRDTPLKVNVAIYKYK